MKLAPVLWVLAIGCKTQISADKVEDLVKEKLVADGIAATVVTCPGGLAAKQGDMFHCGVVIDGASYAVEVTQLDDAGKIKWELDALVLHADHLDKAASSEYGRPITCPKPITVVKIGATTECTVATDPPMTLVVTPSSRTKYTWKTKP